MRGWGLRLAVLALFACSACARVAGPRRVWSVPGGSCSATEWQTQVQATAHGELDVALPAAVASTGSPVRLQGVARRLKVEDRDCRVRSEALDGRWTLTYLPAGGAPIDATRLLSRPDAPEPNFSPDDIGSYRADWHWHEYKSSVWIDVISRKSPEQINYTRRWVSLGPDASLDALGEGTTATGKIEALAFDPASDLIVYAGSSLGGIWRSDDAGEKWRPVTDNKGLEGMSIGAIIVGGDGAVYAGGLRYSKCANGATCRSLPGIWKSTDGGAAWSRTGMNTSACAPGSVQPNGRQMKRFIRHPLHDEWFYAATDRGLLRTFTSGECWEKVADPFFDLAATPFDPNTLYLVSPDAVSLPGVTGEGQVFKTTTAWDPSPTFQRLPHPLFIPAPGAKFAYNEATVAVAPLSSKVYVALASGKRVEFMRSTDGGATWQTGTPPSMLVCSGAADSGGQCSYDLAIAVSPANPDRLIFGETVMWDGLWSASGVTWTSLPQSGLHADVHAIAFASNPHQVYVATDGGVYRGTLAATSGQPMSSAWAARNGGLATTIGFNIAVAPTNAEATAIGQWDNSRVRRDDGRVWHRLSFGEGRSVAFDAGSDATLYGTGHDVIEMMVKRHADGARQFGPVVTGAPGPVGRCSRTFFPCKQNSDCPFAEVVQTCVKDSQVRTVTANPFRPNEVLGQYQEGNGPGELYVIRGFGDAWRCVQPSSDNTAGVVSVDFPSGDTYVISRSHGRSVQRFRIQPLGALQELCSQGTGAVAIDTIYTPSHRDSTVHAAADPFDVNAVYVVEQTPWEARVYHVVHNGASSTVEFLGDAHSVLKGGWINQIVADPEPLAADVLWLATSIGLFEGIAQPGALYRWVRNRSVPDVQVSSIAAHRKLRSDGSTEYSGVLRLSTAGRGVWEGIVRERPRPVKFLAYSALKALDPTSTEAEQREAWIAVRHADDGLDGAYMRVRPTRDGVDTGLFLSETRLVRPGADTLHWIRYAAADAPPALRTDGLELTLLARDRKTVLERRVIPHERLWAREGWDVVAVDAVRIGRGSPDRMPVPISFKVRGATAEPSGSTPQQIAAPRAASIAVTAPETAGGDPLLYFRTWAVDGLPVDSADTTLTTTVRPQARLTALYDREPARPAPVRCGRVHASTCAGTCPEGQICAAREGCRCVPRRGPDLVVTSLGVESAGADCIVIAVIENVGDARAAVSTLSVKGIAGAESSGVERSIAPLASGEARRQRATLHALPCASLNVEANADAHYAIVEREEGNNVLRQQFD